jgi:hypothetical protein
VGAVLCVTNCNGSTYNLKLHVSQQLLKVIAAHRYRRPRLLTVMFSITHARDNHAHSKWQLNRAKIIERYREKTCFCVLRRPTASDPVLSHYFGKN